ncbi:DgyrCDS817 [Dimorphilus gyrociliatus]|uniref:carbonic anhydrase n=1 Tax=Dimorphilus gyrociliatus TaxID=2664684 RepID=A0A7I8V5G3_9ANNE|nr:DgyrCDS817 [Dimorphilus gyrociliatus]
MLNILCILFLVTTKRITASLYNYEFHGADWSEICSTGIKQSPINIDTSRTIDKDNKPFYLRGFNDFINGGIAANNGHTVQISAHDINNIRIDGDGLKSTYYISQFHFHWSNKDGEGSELLVNNVASELEMHVVANRGDNRTINEDSLAVFSFRFKVAKYKNVSSFNKFEKMLLKILPKVTGIGDKVPTEPFKLN